jgi:dTDP-4-amino-4,6-dideoxygalactose transaminase
VHVRINIPAWGRREIAAGAAALAWAGKSAAARGALGRALEAAAPGWRPVLVSSARYAIALAVRAIGLTGARVAVPAYVCPAVLTGLRAAPAEAVPVDCLPSSFAYDPEALALARVAAVLAPNTYGVDQDFAALGRLGLPVIEDAAYQAGRLDPQGRACGTRGDAGVWSFNFKALTAVGGGVLLVRSPAVEVREPGRAGVGEALRFVNYAARSIARHRIPSFLPGASPPSRGPNDELRRALGELRETSMSGLQAAVALAQWEARDRLAALQREHAALLGRVVEGSDALAPLAGPGDAIVHLFPCLAPSGDAAYDTRRRLYERGVQTEDPYPLVWSGPERFPNARDLAERLLLVPSNASLGEAEMRAVARALEGAARAVKVSRKGREDRAEAQRS